MKPWACPSLQQLLLLLKLGISMGFLHHVKWMQRVWLSIGLIGNPAKRTMTDWDGCQCDAILFRWRKYFLFDIIWMPPLWCLLGNLARRKARATVINIVPLIFAEPLHPASSYETFFWNFNPRNIWCHNYFILLHTNTLDLSQLQQLKIIEPGLKTINSSLVGSQSRFQ